MKSARISRASSAWKVLGFLSAAVAADIVALRSALAEPGWTQVWNDEFDGATLDTTKWFAETTNNPANQELQAYRPSQVTVSGGNMVITSRRRQTGDNIGNQQYVSGRVRSVATHLRGRWEIRAQLPTSKGMWPAIWLLPNTQTNPWPSGGEIDILENRGQQPNLTSSAYHFGTSQPFFHDYRFAEQTTARFGQPVNYHTGFHTYAVEWDAQKVRFFVDDVNHWTIYNSDTSNYLASAAPMWTMLNSAVGGQFLGGSNQQPDATTVLPQQFLIDYVRISQKNNDPIKFRNGDFEANDGSMAFWTESNNIVNTNNVSIHNEAAHGNASLKLFGQFSSSTNTSGASQGITVAAGDEVKAIAESFVRTADALAGTNSVMMKIEFYNMFGGRRSTTGDNHFISEVTQTIATSATPKDAWRSHQLTAVAPAGAVEARLAFVFDQPGSSGGAIHIDNVSFINPRFNDPADADDDGDVDADDLGIWSQDYGTSNLAADADGDADVDGDDFLVWQQRLTPPLSSLASTTAVPEPWGVALAVAAFMPLVRPSRSERP